VPTLVRHGDDDQIVPIADSLKVYQGFPDGMCTTHADLVNPELPAFIDEDKASRPSARARSAAPSAPPRPAEGAR
jgi:non-heme chloroperoxidase